MPLSRRDFLAATASCAGYLAVGAPALSAMERMAFGAPTLGRTVAAEPWGHLDEVAQGVWAMISTPLAGPRGSDAWKTICNGGIVAGRSGVLLIEGFGTPEGAQWLYGRAKELTGRAPTHVILTHFHSDHSGGLSGYAAEAEPPRQHATERTRKLLVERAADGTTPFVPEEVLPGDRAWALDVGGRTVTATPRLGHTPSDVSLEVDGVVFAGDLVWIGMFPNYVDAIPSDLSRSVRSLLAREHDVLVPGHGALADPDALRRYVALLDDVEAAARRAYDAGVPAAEAARSYAPPASLGEWVTFSAPPAYYERALGAWMKGWEGGGRR